MAKPSDLFEVRIRRVPPQLRTELLNISKNLGMDISSLLKPKIQDYVNSQPAHLKQPPKN